MILRATPDCMSTMGVCVTPAGGFVFRSVCLRFFLSASASVVPGRLCRRRRYRLKLIKNYFLSISSPELLQRGSVAADATCWRRPWSCIGRTEGGRTLGAPLS